MTQSDKIKDIFNSGKYTIPIPDNPGQYAMTKAGDEKVKQTIAEGNLPVIYYTESNNPGNLGGYQFLVPAKNVNWGAGANTGYGREIEGLGYVGSFFEYTYKNAKKNGVDMRADPLGLNYNAKRQVVQYRKLPETGMPIWYPQPGSPAAMSGASIIYEGRKPKKIVTGDSTYDIVGA